jgi:26S proteasome regulatory subunit N6
MAVTPAKDDEKRIEEAQKLAKSEPAKAEAIYKDVLTKNPGSTDSALRSFEKALVGLGELLRDQKRADDLADLIRQTRSALSSFAKSKTAKLGMWSMPC